jgi:hypothetical protein
MKKNIIVFIITLFLIFVGSNIVNSHELEYSSKLLINNPPKIIKSLTYYDKYNDILYVTASDPDNDKICVGIDWNRDQIIDEWSTYRRIQTRWEFDCSGRYSRAYIIAEDIHGLQSEWYNIDNVILNLNQNYFFKIFLVKNIFKFI